MTQATGVIANGSGASVRAAITAALGAINSGHAGTTVPSYVAGGMMYWRTDVPGSGTWTLYAYDGASSVAIGTLNTSTHVWTPSNTLAATILTTQGDILYQGASAAARLAAGADAYKGLFTGGSGANPSWAGTWKVLGEATPSGASSVAFTGIPAAVHHLHLLYELIPSSDGAVIGVQTYGADGNVDTGSTDYLAAHFAYHNGGSTGGAGFNTSSVPLQGSVGVDAGGSFGIAGEIVLPNIQAARHTSMHYRTAFFNTDASLAYGSLGSGWRLEADRITGVRLIPSAGNVTGRAVLLGMSN